MVVDLSNRVVCVDKSAAAHLLIALRRDVRVIFVLCVVSFCLRLLSLINVRHFRTTEKKAVAAGVWDDVSKAKSHPTAPG